MDQMQATILHRAARIIEADGVDGYRSATRLVGEGAANALLIAHMRRNLGSTETYPARPEIATQVNQQLEKAGILKQ